MITITNISRLWGVHSLSRLCGEQMAAIPYIDNAFVKIKGEKIVDFGAMEQLSAQGEILDAQGAEVLPSFCDSHTHLIYATSREEEFIDRVRGLSYAEIAQRGGGILNSADKLRQMSEDELFESAKERCQQIILTGTGAVEIKSGYGLSVESELKMLRVVARLKEALPLEIRATFLGAHAVPREYQGRQQEYVDMLCAEMLPAVAAEGLADYVDVFCDEGFFTTAQTAQILDEAAKYNIQGKIHANELAISGGVELGVAHGALSVDHLEEMNGASINALKGATTIGTALPGASFFLGIPYAPVRVMVDQGLPIAIASDFNPGSSPSGNMPFMMALSVIKSKLLPTEALAAATINGAYAMGLDGTHGSIAVGKTANLLIMKKGSTLDHIPYYHTENHIDKIILKGKIQ